MKNHMESRFEWAVAEMDLQPEHSVLEIGPGTGIALEIITKRVSAGSVVALDQSSSMIAKAESRLKKSGLNQRVTFIRDNAEAADLSRFRFDRVFAFNVSIFYKDTDLSHVFDRVLKGGMIGIFFQNPPGSDKRRLIEMLGKVKAILSSNRIQVINLPVYYDVKDTPTGGVVARKN
jgi:ubiquinone/menaquinone biosynthesis C-methylase UbiE